MRTSEELIGTALFSCCANCRMQPLVMIAAHENRWRSLGMSIFLKLIFTLPAYPGGRACTIGPCSGSLEGGRPASGIPSVSSDSNHKAGLCRVWRCQSCAQTENDWLISDIIRSLIREAVVVLSGGHGCGHGHVSVFADQLYACKLRILFCMSQWRFAMILMRQCIETMPVDVCPYIHYLRHA